jgi:hypothetical protein
VFFGQPSIYSQINFDTDIDAVNRAGVLNRAGLLGFSQKNKPFIAAIA